MRAADEAVAAARDQARYYERVILPLRQQIVEQTQLQYNAMQIGIFQLLQAHRDQLDIELAYVETLREYWSAAAALDTLRAGHRVDIVGAADTDPMNAGSEPAGGH